MRIEQLDTGRGYVVYHDDGTATYDAVKYEVRLNGESLDGVCCGVDDHEGWAEVFVQDDGSEDGFAGPRLAQIPKFKVGELSGTKTVLRARIAGTVEIVKRDAQREG